MQILIGHTSPETAFVVADYPYGFRLRCQIRYWIETTKHGQRFVSQTSNPKRDGLVWNKPKASTYSDVLAMYLDDQGHVHQAGITLVYCDAERLNTFIEQFGEALQDDRGQKFLKHARAIFETRKYVEFKITVGGEAQPKEEKDAIMSSLAHVYRHELAKQEVT